MSAAALVRAFRLCLIALYAVAMTTAAVLPSTAMAVEGPVAAIAGEPLPGGEVAYLCHGAAETSGQPHTPGDASHPCCDACLLASAPGLGAVATIVLPVPTRGLSSPLAAYSVRLAEIRRMQPSSRGPPALA